MAGFFYSGFVVHDLGRLGVPDGSELLVTAMLLAASTVGSALRRLVRPT
jgi:hypothetical protein